MLHYDNKVVGIFFPWSSALTDAVRRIRYAHYSKTLKGWHTTWRDGVVREIRDAFEGVADVVQESSEVLGNIDDLSPKREIPIPMAYKQLLTRKRYSEATVRNYCSQFQAFINFFHRDPGELTEGEINLYMKFLIEKRKISASTQNMAINAIKFYFEHVRKGEAKNYRYDRPMKETKLPVVLSKEEVSRLFDSCEN